MCSVCVCVCECVLACVCVWGGESGYAGVEGRATAGGGGQGEEGVQDAGATLLLMHVCTGTRVGEKGGPMFVIIGMARRQRGRPARWRRAPPPPSPTVRLLDARKCIGLLGSNGKPGWGLGRAFRGLFSSVTHVCCYMHAAGTSCPLLLQAPRLVSHTTPLTPPFPPCAGLLLCC